MSGLLAKYPVINGIIDDYGATASGVTRAYRSAGRPSTARAIKIRRS